MIQIHELNIESARWVAVAGYESPAASDVSIRKHFVFAEKPVQIRHVINRRLVLRYLHPMKAVLLDAEQPCEIQIRSIAPPVAIQHAAMIVSSGDSLLTNGEPVDAERLRRICAWRCHYAVELPKHPHSERRKPRWATPDEIQQAISMRAEGATIHEIALTMDRTIEVISRWLRNARSNKT